MENNWDCENYTNHFSFVHRYGSALLDLLTVKPGSFVVDLGCGETVHRALGSAFAAYGLTYVNCFNFQSVGTFAPVLERHGFRVEYATLFDRPTQQDGENGLENWIRMFVGSAFAGIEGTTADSIVAQTVSNCRPVLYKNGKWFVDYVRLRMKAVKL